MSHSTPLSGCLGIHIVLLFLRAIIYKSAPKQAEAHKHKSEAIRKVLEKWGIVTCSEIQVVRTNYWEMGMEKPMHCSLFLTFESWLQAFYTEGSVNCVNPTP